MIPRRWLEEWCDKHNLTLIDIRNGGFTYQTYNGMLWYMSYREWLAGDLS